LRQGDYSRETTYPEEPIEVAVRFAQEGADGLHVVDLDGALSGKPVHLETLCAIVEGTSIPVEFGGGIRDLDAIAAVLDAGATRAVLGTRLAKDRQFAVTAFDRFGDRIVAGIDSKDGRVAVQGWVEATDLNELHFALSLAEMGCKRAIVTDINRDGMMLGPNLLQLRTLVEATGMEIIASGGISSLQDLQDVRDVGVAAAVVGRAIYEGAFTVNEAVALARKDPISH